MTDPRVELANLLSRYCYAIDERRWDELRDCFMPDAVLDYDVVGQPLDADAFVDLAVEKLAQLAQTQHLLGTVHIAVNGQSATMQSYVQAVHVKESGESWVNGGVYKDEAVQTDRGWRIARRNYAVLWSSDSTDPMSRRS